MLTKKNIKSAPTVNDKNTNAALPKSFGLRDLIVIILFVLLAALFVNLFIVDLFQTFNLRNVEPVGFVILRKNTVQRRLADRVLWDRLATESPVYLGDLIRVAELSAATLVMDGSSIDLNENTLIRITRAADGDGLQIIMTEGNLSFTGSEGGGRILFDINGMQLQPGASSAFNVTSAARGVSVHVNEGSAQVFEEGNVRQLQAGNLVMLDAGGRELEQRAAVVIHPVSNARFLNDDVNAFNVNFSWNRINLEDNELLRLEVAGDRNFNNIVNTQENLYRQTRISFNNGFWHWRLLHENTELAQGQITVIDSRGPSMQTTSERSSFNVTEDAYVVEFGWNEVNEASSYILEVSNTENFASPVIQRQSQVTSFSQPWFTDSKFTEGTWYWRVKPVFPSVFAGNSSFSQASNFTVERARTAAVNEDISLAGLLAETAQEAAPPPAVAPVLHLNSPARGTRIDGLTALRRETVFTWECEGEITSARFVLSRNADPFSGTPFMQIQNPQRSISVELGDEGTWYWNVEAQTASGFTVRGAQHGMLQISASSMLPAPRNMRPAREHRITMSELQARRSINFNWQAVSGANTYFFTIVQQTISGRRLVYQSLPLNRTSYVLEDLHILDNGTFIWQVEAVNSRQNGTIDRHGLIAESTFIMDIILPGAIQVEGTGIVYED